MRRRMEVGEWGMLHNDNIPWHRKKNLGVLTGMLNLLLPCVTESADTGVKTSINQRGKVNSNCVRGMKDKDDNNNNNNNNGYLSAPLLT